MQNNKYFKIHNDIVNVARLSIYSSKMIHKQRRHK